MKFIFPVLMLAALLSSCCGKSCETNAVAADNREVRINVFYTPGDTADIQEIKAVADSLVQASRTDAGCIYYDFLESTTAPGEFMIVETWENDSLLEIHSRAPHFEKFVPRLRAMGSMASQKFKIDD